MDIRTLHEIGDHETLDQLRTLRESADTRVEREVVQLTIDLLGPRPGLAMSSLRLLVEDYLPWLERRSVHRARDAGMSWAGIARLLGITRQAVQQRFTVPVSMTDVIPPPELRRPDAEGVRRRDDAQQRRRVADADSAGSEGGLVPW